MIDFLFIYLILAPLILGPLGYIFSLKFEKAREYFFITITALELIGIIILLLINDGHVLNLPLLGLGLSFKLDAFRGIYAVLSIFLWLMTITFSKEYMHHYNSKNRYYMFYLLTLAGVVGVFLSNDLFTTFVFFEIMSISSYPLVIHDEKDESMKAGSVYLAIAIVTGMILLMGLFLLYSNTQTLVFSEIRDYVNNTGLNNTMYVAGILMLLGFGAKAGMYPLHVWLPAAHPVAPAPASALLSGILTKTGVFGIIVISANLFFEESSFAYILLAAAVITMFLGALLALFSVNLKRTLACSSMSQIGFILVGISFYMLLGEEGGIASFGSLLHMMNHSLIKLVLFMAAGVVVMNLHELDLNKIQGFGRKKYFFMIVFLIGALGIMGVPLFNGYVSKTMIHEAIVEYINEANLFGKKLVLFKAIEYTFLFSGGLTVAYMTKLFVCLFIKKNVDADLQAKYDAKTNYMSLLSKIVFVISCIALPVIGILPNLVGVGITNLTHGFFYVEELEHHIEFFGFECLKGGIISIAIGALVYFFFVRLVLTKNNRYLNLWPKWLDLQELFYKPLIKICLWILSIFKFIDTLPNKIVYFNFVGKIVRFISLLPDGIIYLFRKTIFKPVAYSFNPESLTYRIGEYVDEKRNTKTYAHKFEHTYNTLKNGFMVVSNSFSFAMGMACLGLILIILYIFIV